MFDTISMYLETHATPEQKQVCMAGCQSLADAGVTDHVDILSDEIAAIDSQSPITDDLMLSIIHSVLIPMHRNALGEFGIVLSADVTLLVITDILNGIRALGNYGDPATLNSLCDAPEGPEAALADMLELVGAFTAAEYLPVLETVNPQLLDRIEQLTTGTEALDQPEQQAVALARSRTLKLFAVLGAEQTQGLLAFQYINDGGRLGTYAHDLLAQFREPLAALPPAALAANLLALVLITQTPYDFILSTVKHELAHITSDMDVISVTIANVGKLLQKVENA